MLANKGITYLGSFHNGFRQLTNSKHAVTTPEDLKGLKIRVPGSAVYMGVFKALGASPTAMSWSEVFTAIQQGTIDGQENGCSVTKSAKMDEIQDYMTIWNYSYETSSSPTQRSGRTWRTTRKSFSSSAPRSPASGAVTALRRKRMSSSRASRKKVCRSIS